MIHKSIFTLIFFSLFFYGAFAQNVKTLEQCINIAWENNINVKQAYVGQAQSRIDLTQAKASRYPSLSTGASLNVSGRAVDPTSNTFVENNFYNNNYNLSSNVLLYNGGTIRKNIERAKISETSANLQADEIRQNIALQVANNYLNVLFAQENLQVAKKRLEITQTQLDQVGRLINAGLRPKNDKYELEATIAANDQALITSQGNLELAFLQLKQSMRIPVSEDFALEIPEVLMVDLEDPFTLRARDIYMQSLENQPAVQRSEVGITLAEIDQDIAKAAYQPTLAIGGSVGTNWSSSARSFVGAETIFVPTTIQLNGMDAEVGLPQVVPEFENISFGNQIQENITYGYGLSLSVPIYTNFRNKANVLRADLGRESAVLNDMQIKDQFRQQIEQALIDARNAKKQYDAAEKSVIASKRSLDNLVSGFAQGTTNNFELNIATNQYDNAVVQSLIAKYDYIFTMKVLDFYMGKTIGLK